MILAINVYNLAYTIIFLLSFLICYLLIVQTRLENLFKQGRVWEIRVSQVIIALILAYLLTQGIMSLVNATQFA